ncbi:hypothetical protein ABZS29_38565 [Kribbella sp. NPDC005582]|uniref:hypothetical protein n=1 Tax=Kribbella sp. NPDC005582 TaxID=3156893 RepID=UPI0033B83117
MTVRPVRTPAARDRAHTELTATVARKSAPPACSMSDEFTQEVQPIGRTLALIEMCRSCPVLEQCADLATQLMPRDKAHTVTAGVRYDGAGRPVDLTKLAAQAELDRRLAALGDVA